VSTFVADFLKRRDDQIARKGKAPKKTSAGGAPNAAAVVAGKGKAGPAIPGAEGWQQPGAAPAAKKGAAAPAAQKGKGVAKNGFAVLGSQ
jgi:hypothetical protein